MNKINEKLQVEGKKLKDEPTYELLCRCYYSVGRYINDELFYKSHHRRMNQPT